MKREEFIEELETLILNNEDDFDRGKGKFIIREFISSLKSSLQDETSKVITNEKAKEVCCGTCKYGDGWQCSNSQTCKVGYEFWEQ